MISYIPVISLGYQLKIEWEEGWKDIKPIKNLDDCKYRINLHERLKKMEESYITGSFFQIMTTLFIMYVFKPQKILTVVLASISILNLGLNIQLIRVHYGAISSHRLKMLEIFSRTLQNKIEQINSHIKENELFLFDDSFSELQIEQRERLITPILEKIKKIGEDLKLLNAVAKIRHTNDYKMEPTKLFQPAMNLEVELRVSEAILNRLKQSKKEYEDSKEGEIQLSWAQFIKDLQTNLKKRSFQIAAEEFIKSAKVQLKSS